jgi:hypothetical protein
MSSQSVDSQTKPEAYATIVSETASGTKKHLACEI